jgi:predicted O-methyltransferase YrrM
MGVQDFEYILGLIRQGKSNEILELGSGTSTLIFASEIAKLHGNGAIISLEGERQSFKKTQNLLHQCQLSHYAKVYHTPYERYPNYIWYNKKRVEAILKGKQFDVLIVDGPSGYIYPCSRMPAIPLLLPHIKQSGIIILHDAKRPDEDHIVREWRSFFHECEFINTRSGLAIFKHKRVTHKIEMLTS